MTKIIEYSILIFKQVKLSALSCLVTPDSATVLQLQNDLRLLANH